MKKTFILIALLLAMSFLMAQRYVTDISYYDDSGAHAQYYTQVPSAVVSEIGVRFTAEYPITQLQALHFYLYGVVGAPTGLIVKVHNADANGLPTGMALGTTTIAPANLTVGGWNDLDVTGWTLSFAQGAKFIMTLSCQGGVATTIGYQFLLNRIASTEFPSHSVRLYNGAWVAYQGVTVGGVANSGGEYHMSATVDYNAPFHDVSAKSLWFTGDLFLDLNQSVAYEADVENTGDQTETNVPVTLQIENVTYPARTIVYTNTQNVASMAPAAIAHIATFPAYQFATAGEYVVTLMTTLPVDMDATNNTVYLEQQVIVLPTTYSYDDGTAESAWAPNVAHNYFANEFESPYGPVILTDLHFYMWGTAWPSPGSTNMGIAVFDDDGYDADNLPGAPGTRLYYSEVTCTRGAWNNYDISDAQVIIGSGKFFVAYRSLDDYPNVPGLAVDNNYPWSAWKVSWETSEGLWYQSYPDFNMDWMIRATGSYIEFWAPEDLTIMQSGNDINLDWTDVPEASYYDVYQGTSPTTITNRIGANVTGSQYTITGGANGEKSFYKVTSATTEIRGTHPKEAATRKAQNNTRINNQRNILFTN
jgi:hypothetical protein